jgi:acylphosphatase
VARRAHLVFEGRVQGVFFRASTQRIAREMQLTGWVRNLKDGSVEAVVEGDERAVEELVARLKVEVRAADVERVKVVWSEAEREFRAFEVRGEDF